MGLSRRLSLKNRGAGRPPVPAILFVVGLVVVVLLFITLRQIKSAEARRLRLLASFSDRVELTVQNLADRFVTTVVEQPDRAGVYLDQVPHLELLVPPRAVREERAPAAEGATAPVGEDGPAPEAASLPELTLEASGSRVDLTYRWRTEADDVAEDGAAGAGSEAVSTDLEAVARIDLQALLEPVIIPDVFDAILVTDDRGTVLFQVGESELRATSVQALFERRGPPDEPGLLSDEGEPEAAIGFGSMRQATGMVKRDMGGNEYRVFVQPVSLGLRARAGQEAPHPTHWAVCGLVSSDRLLSSGVTTSPVLLFLLVALFPVGLVSWPFLKLWLISPRQRFTRLDAAFLLFATILGLSLATLLVMDLMFLWTTNRTVDDELQALSAALERSLREELVRSYVQLESLEDDADLRTRVRYLSIGSPDEIPQDTAIDELLAREIRGAVEVEQLCAYPWLRSLFWADPEGEQAVKLPFYEEAILANRIDDRGYFDCALRVARGEVPPRGSQEVIEPPPPRGSFAGRFTLRPPDPPVVTGELPCPLLSESRPAEITLCLEPLLDRTTGQDRMVLSVAREDDEDLPVAALVARPLSLTYPVLAPGFGFALIEPGGRVLSHSDPRRNLTESFLKASDEDRVLSSVLDARRAGWLDLVYQGRRRRAYVRPLDGLPWNLITFRSTRDLRLRNFELVYDFLNPLVVYTVLVNLAFALLVAFAPGRWLRHLWPSWRYLALYRKIVLGGVPLIALFAVILAFGGRRIVFYASFGLPFLALVLIGMGFVVELRRRRAREREEWETPDRPGGGEGGREAPDGEDGAGPRTATWGAGMSLGVAGALGLPALLHAWTQGRAVLEVSFLVLVVWIWGAAYWRRRSNFHGRQRRVAYTFALKVLLLVLSVLPALGFFHLASSRQLQFWRQDAQLGLAAGIESRQLALEAARGPVEELYERFEPVLEAMEEHFLASFGSQRLGAGAGASASAEPACDPGLWVYDRGEDACLGLVDRLLSARPLPLNDLTIEPVGTDLSRFERPAGSWSLGDDGRIVASLAQGWGTGEPVRLATTLPGPAFPRKLGAAQLVILSVLLLGLAAAPSLFARFVAEHVLLISLIRGTKREPVQEIFESLPKRYGQGEKRLLLVTENPQLTADKYEPEGFRVLQFEDLGSEGADGNGAQGSESGAGDEDAGGSSSGGALDGVGSTADEGAPADAEEGGSEAPEELRGWLVRGFSADPDPKVAQRRIAAIEKLQEEQNVPLVLLVESYPRLPGELGRHEEPKDLQDEQGREGKTSDRPGTGESSPAGRRWSQFLAGFAVRYGRTSPIEETPLYRYVVRRLSDLRKGGRTNVLGQLAHPQARHEERLLVLILDECRHGWRLQRCGREVLTTADLGLFTGNQVVSRIGVLAEPYYESLWGALDADEKVVLVQLAEEGVVNPKSQDTVLKLLHRGLVLRDPSLRPMNRSFARFVLRQPRRLDARRREAEEGSSPWSVLKWLLPLPLLLLAGFLFITQREAVTNLVAILLAAASLAPMFFNLSGQLQQLGGRSGGNGDGA